MFGLLTLVHGRLVAHIISDRAGINSPRQNGMGGILWALHNKLVYQHAVACLFFLLLNIWTVLGPF